MAGTFPWIREREPAIDRTDRGFPSMSCGQAATDAFVS
ncbi:hypothetical protein YT1_5223 [Rhodococcus ruber]|nr:hypothetical protein YT1_5223 [Rhodococcus ruber]